MFHVPTAGADGIANHCEARSGKKVEVEVEVVAVVAAETEKGTGTGSELHDTHVIKTEVITELVVRAAATGGTKVEIVTMPRGRVEVEVPVLDESA